MRFERGADPQPAGAWRWQRALRAARGDRRRARRAAPIVDRYPIARRAAAPCGCAARGSAGLLGARDCRMPTSARILDGLGFDAARRRTTAGTSTVPTRRVDVLREVDLIEEVARHYGFDRLPATFPALTSAAAAARSAHRAARHLRARPDRRRLLRGGDVRLHRRGRRGAVRGRGRPRADREPAVRELRRAAAVGAAGPGRRRGAQPPARAARRPAVRDRRALLAQRRRAPRRSRAPGPAPPAREHWSGGARDVDFFDMKGVVERVCEALRVETRTEPHRGAVAGAGTRRGASWPTATRIGVLGQLAPAIGRAPRAAAADAGLRRRDRSRRRRSARAGHVRSRIEPLPRFPSVTRDISILVDDTLRGRRRARHDPRRGAGRRSSACASSIATRARAFPRARSASSLRLTFRSSDRTLTDAEVQAAMDAVLAALTRAPRGGSAIVRNRQSASAVIEVRVVAFCLLPTAYYCPCYHSRSLHNEVTRSGNGEAGGRAHGGSRADRSARGEDQAARRHGDAASRGAGEGGRRERAADRRRSTRCARAWPTRKRTADELVALRDERDVVRSRVADMLQQLEAI